MADSTGDVLNRASTAEFASIVDKFPSLAGDVEHTLSYLNEYNNFLGINIGNSPSYMVSNAWNSPDLEAGLLFTFLVLKVAFLLTGCF